jgi:hypothetical protein
LKLLEFPNTSWKAGILRDEREAAVTSPIFKKEDRIECFNYISLFNSSYKIYAKALSNRVNKITENILKKEQNAFRRGRSCMNCVFTVTQLI